MSAIFNDNPLISFRRNLNIRACWAHSALEQKLSQSVGTFPF